MYRYIIATYTPDTAFDTSTTGMSYYNNFLNEKDAEYMQEAKNLKGEIVYMTPEEYYDHCSNEVFKSMDRSRASSEALKRSRYDTRDKEDTRFVDKYIQMMEDGTSFHMCVLDLADNTQEGLHRMYAAGELFGWDTEFPVLVVTPYDQDRWDTNKKIDDAYYFNRYELKDICKDVCNRLSDRDAPLPDDVSFMLDDAIEQEAKEQGYNIHVNCIMNIRTGKFEFYLVDFEGFNWYGYKDGNAEPAYTVFVSDMYDYDPRDDLDDEWLYED